VRGIDRSDPSWERLAWRWPGGLLLTGVSPPFHVGHPRGPGTGCAGSSLRSGLRAGQCPRVAAGSDVIDGDLGSVARASSSLLQKLIWERTAGPASSLELACSVRWGKVSQREGGPKALPVRERWGERCPCPGLLPRPVPAAAVQPPPLPTERVCGCSGSCCFPPALPRRREMRARIHPLRPCDSPAAGEEAGNAFLSALSVLVQPRWHCWSSSCSSWHKKEVDT